MILKVSFSLIIIALFISINSYSQFINMDKTIDYINGKLNKSCVVDTKKADLLLTFYNNNNETRIDRVPFDMLDHQSVVYNEDEKAIIIKCTNKEDCISRKLIKEKIKRYYSRLNVPYEGDSISCKGLEKAFKHLILLVNYDSYKSNEPFE